VLCAGLLGRRPQNRLTVPVFHPHVTMQTAVYTSLPTWRMLAFDGTLYLSAFGASSEGHRSGMYKLTAAGDGVLYAGFLRQFEDMWRQAHPSNGRQQS
jgi:hypothetical protein